MGEEGADDQKHGQCESMQPHVKRVDSRRELQTNILVCIKNAQSESSILSQLKRVGASREIF